MKGAVDAKGVFTAPADGNSAGFVKATVGARHGQARVRVIPPLPWSFDFENPGGEAPPPQWVNAPTKLVQRTVEGVGNVLVRPRDETVGRRAKVLIGPTDWSNYTIEADVRGREQRRQRGDVGLINQRYGLVLFGNGQKLELQPWQAADELTVRVPFTWDADTWYRMKLRVENQPNGQTLVRGKVWKAASAEPAAWTIEKIDTIPHRAGSPGHLRRRHLGRVFRQHEGLQEPVGHSEAQDSSDPSRLKTQDPGPCARSSRSFFVAGATVALVRRLADVGRHARPQHGVVDDGAADRVGRQDRRRT